MLSHIAHALERIAKSLEHIESALRDVPEINSYIARSLKYRTEHANDSKTVTSCETHEKDS